MIEKDYRDYIEDIFNNINDIEQFVSKMSFEEFSEDKKTTNAVIRSLEVLKLSERQLKISPNH